MQNNVNSIRITSLYGSLSSFVVFACKTATLGPELQVSMCPRHHLCIFCIQNSAFSTRIASLNDSQTSPVVLCMQNNVISIRINSLYGSQPSFVVFACKTVPLGPEKQVSMGPRPHLCFFCIQNSDFSTRIASVYGSQPSSVVFACNTVTFRSELQVSMGPRLLLVICECKTAYLDPEWCLSIGPSLHLWFCTFKTATLAPELQFLWVPTLICGFVHSQQRHYDQNN